MDIFFRQSKQKNQEICNLFNAYGIEDCCFKRLSFENDRVHITRKSHYHTFFEVHIIDEGFQEYEVGGKRFFVKAGELLLLPPFLKHVTVSEDARTRKHALTFSVRKGGPLENASGAFSVPLIEKTPPSVNEAIVAIERERAQRLARCEEIISVRMLEAVLSLLRLKEKAEAGVKEDAENERFLLVKEYIEANSSRPISLLELASYACISEKQLERIFIKEMGESVMLYARRRRCKRIEALLCDPTLSLREVSERTGFSNEYYFNAFFKKYAGMTPGSYRKAVLK